MCVSDIYVVKLILLGVFIIDDELYTPPIGLGKK